jgi:3-deoxy-manno-octulosonate cytidylyltransferase (CMP-KDO synthetase)
MILGIIPARMDSSRFPGKPLKEILGLPMIAHVYHRSKMSNVLSEVYVATCDEIIFDYIESIGGKAIMTSKKHERATDRTAEALINIEDTLGKKAEIVVMLQGDEPMIVPSMIQMGVEPLINDPSIQVSNLMKKIDSSEEWGDPNEVKVVVDNNDNALYFSREPIPSKKKFTGKINAYKQVCIITFKRNTLLTYLDLSPTPLEIIESVDMNRFLEHGIGVKLVRSNFSSFAVDTKKDLEFVEKAMKDDNLVKSYF